MKNEHMKQELNILNDEIIEEKEQGERKIQDLSDQYQ